MTTLCKGRAPAKLSFATRLDRLAQVAVKVGLRPLPGQQVIMTAPIEALPLVRLITEHAYKAGASLVTTLFNDDECTLARYKYAAPASFDVAQDWLFDGFAKGLSDGAARLAISGDRPDLLDGQDRDYISRAEKARAAKYQPVIDLITTSHTNWNICAYATKEWAKLVFPNQCETHAQLRLWDAVFAASRVDGDDPIEEWSKHNRMLQERRDYLNAKRFAALSYRGPGTDLTIGLADDHEWAGGAGVAKNGVIFNANIPTEEVFTMPHRLRVNGFVSSTKPLSTMGSLVKDIRVRFENGRIVEAAASQGGELLNKLIATDEGSAYLGEVALVPHSSAISQTGLLFFNTLFDENAASHIAIGQSYAKTVRGGKEMTKEQLVEKGANFSTKHVDWMIGSGEVDVDGITHDGESQPLMRKGEWV